MNPVILTTGSYESKLIINRLHQRDKGVTNLARLVNRLLRIAGQRRKNLYDHPQHLRPYIHKSVKLPILVMGSGLEHDKSHDLSTEIEGHYDPKDLIKVMIDQHDDSKQVSQMGCGSHLHHTQNQGIFSKIYVVGPAEGPDKRISYSENLDTSIAGKKIHLSIDMDFLEERYISKTWTPGRRGFEELLGMVNRLTAANTIIALDICGLAPLESWEDSTSKSGKHGPVSYYELPDGRLQQRTPVVRFLQLGEEPELPEELLNRGVKHYDLLIQAVVSKRPVE